MNPMFHRCRSLLIHAFALSGLSLGAQPFPQGTAITIPEGTRSYDLPPDGVLRCTTLTVNCGGVLAFRPNALNTPVTIIATSNVVITGGIVVSGGDASRSFGGVGGPGGFPGGSGGIAGGNAVGGDGNGPGAGRNLPGLRGGVFAWPWDGNTNVYGNALLYPLIGGSGGAGLSAVSANFGWGGGGGGGAILISSATSIQLWQCGFGLNGAIVAKGGTGDGPGGSGGAIRLVAPVVTGNGTLNTEGGLGNYFGGSYRERGHAGRIRIDCLDDYAYRSLSFVGSFSRGSQMWISQPNSPRIDIVHAAGQDIPVGAGNSVVVPLPFGSTTNQPVRLRAENFTNAVPVRVAVTPDTGPAQHFDAVIPASPDPSELTVNVVVPAGTISRIHAWTR